MTAPFRLQTGDRAPVQQSRTTCGSASLTVARMLVNPGFARWIRLGLEKDAGGDDAADPGGEDQRFAAYEQVVAGRTNALVGAGGRIQLPWPRAFGTPPWGARNELEFGAASRGSAYSTRWFRFGDGPALDGAYGLLRQRVREGRPALLYIGSAWLPRHVVLVLPGTGGQQLDAYEPSTGRVVDLPRRSFVERRLRLAGWDVPWAAVWARDGSRG